MEEESPNHMAMRDPLFSDSELPKVFFRARMQWNTLTAEPGLRRFTTKTIVHLLQFAHSGVNDFQRLINDIRADIVARYQRSRQPHCSHGMPVIRIVISYIDLEVERRALLKRLDSRCIQRNEL